MALHRRGLISVNVFFLALLVMRVTCEAASGRDLSAYLECYSCRAYEFEEDFTTKLLRCESAQTEDTVQCPYKISRESQGEMKSFNLVPSCTVVKQKAAGAITSYTRGCQFVTNCTNLDLCGESTNETGVCISCCNSDLCNTAPSIVRLSGLWTLAAAILLALLFVR